MTVATEISKINYNLRAGQYGGSLIYPSDWVLSKLGNLMMTMPSEADIVTESASQQYPIGTQLRKNGKLYRYSKAGEAMTANGFLKCNYTLCPGSATNSQNSGYEEAIAASVAAGATSFTISDTAAAKNLYENAHMVVYNDTDGCYEQHTVLGNDITNGTTTTLYIAPPGFKKAITGVSGTGYGVTIYLNPYRNVRAFSTGGGYASAVGYAGFDVTSAYYFWLQTAGPISGLTFGNDYSLGKTQYGRDAFSNTDGSIIGAAASATLIHYQRIGYLLSRSASDYGDNFIMMQLDQ